MVNKNDIKEIEKARDKSWDEAAFYNGWMQASGSIFSGNVLFEVLVQPSTTLSQKAFFLGLPLTIAIGTGIIKNHFVKSAEAKEKEIKGLIIETVGKIVSRNDSTP